MKRSFHLIFGLLMLILGGYWGFRDVFNVMDVFKGFVHFLFMFLGFVLLSVAIFREKHKKINIPLGAILMIVGVIGLVDEWDIVADVLRGIFPPAFCVLGVLALFAGIHKLKA